MAAPSPRFSFTRRRAFFSICGTGVSLLRTARQVRRGDRRRALHLRRDGQEAVGCHLRPRRRDLPDFAAASHLWQCARRGEAPQIPPLPARPSRRAAPIRPRRAEGGLSPLLAVCHLRACPPALIPASMTSLTGAGVTRNTEYGFRSTVRTPSDAWHGLPQRRSSFRSSTEFVRPFPALAYLEYLQERGSIEHVQADSAAVPKRTSLPSFTRNINPPDVSICTK